MSFHLPWILLGLIILAFSVAKELNWEAKRRRLPASIAWVGPRNEYFSMFRAWMREYTAGLKTVEEGYTKVSRAEPHGRVMLGSHSLISMLSPG